MRLILASASQRRQDLLASIGVVPSAIRPADIDETPQCSELPGPYADRMAAEKAAVIAFASDEIVLAADTVVAAGRRILGKPTDAEEALAFLSLLSGRRHKVITSVAIRSQGLNTARRVETTVKMKRLSREERDRYISSKEWQGKAGGYAIQGLAATFIPWIKGSYSAVVGLPLAETANLLQAAGYTCAHQGAET